MSEIRARRARQLQQIASLVGLTEKFRPAAREAELARLRRFLSALSLMQGELTRVALYLRFLRAR